MTEDCGMGKIIIRRMETEEELRGKAYVHCRAWKEAYAGIVDQAFLDGRTVEMSVRMARRGAEMGIPTLLAVDGDRVIGFADYGPCRDGDMPGCGEVFAIYILRDYYGRGVGRALMDKALSGMPEYDKVAVWVLKENNRAIHFYERCGFRFDGAEKALKLGTEVTEARMVRGKA